MKSEQLVNKVVKDTNSALTAYQKWLNSGASVDNFGRVDWELLSNSVLRDKAIVSEIEQQYKDAGLILDSSSVPVGTISHDIDWKTIDAAYQSQLMINGMMVQAYKENGRTYGGRSLFSTYDKENISIDRSTGIDRKQIQTDGYLLYDTGLGFGGEWLKDSNGKSFWKGNYKKLDAQAQAINKLVLQKFWDSQYKATEKHLLEKFKQFDGDLTTQGFSKKIKLTQELIADVRKSKQWAKEVEAICRRARAIQLGKKKLVNKVKNQFIKSSYILSMQDLIKIGQAILGRSTELCPIFTGFLRSSGTLYVIDNYIRIIYECPYAQYVHENVNAVHPIGQAKFLEVAAQEILQNQSVWVESTNNFVNGSYMGLQWEKDSTGTYKKPTWTEHTGYGGVYIEIDRDLNVNYVHYRKG